MELSKSEQAVNFLKVLIPNGLWILSAIDPKDGSIETRTYSAAKADQAVDWVTDWNEKRNLYFSVNQPDPRHTEGRLSKDKIKEVHFLHVDLDPRKGRNIEDERKQILTRITGTLPKDIPTPSAMNFSGGGYQLFWRLDPPSIVENREQRETLEKFNIWLQTELKGDKCHNLDRIMRLPFTLNIPTKSKLAEGRVETWSRGLHNIPIEQSKGFPLNRFSLEVTETTQGDQDTPEPTKVDTGPLQDEITEELRAGAQRIDDLEEFGKEYGIPTRTLLIIREGKGEDNDIIKKQQDGKDLSRNGWLYDVVCELERRRVPRRIILGIIMEPNLDRWKISESVLDNKAYPSPRDYAERQIRDAANHAAAGRLIQEQVAGTVANLDPTGRRLALSKLCMGPRAKTFGLPGREEAEGLDPLLKALNSYLTFVDKVGGGKPRICTWGKRPEIGEGKTVTLDKSTVQDFHLQYKGLKVETGYAKDNKGVEDLTKPTRRPLTDWWIEHDYKNEKIRIAFDPQERDADSTVNEWMGFTYPQDPNGKYDLFLEHMLENICDGNEEHFTYLKKWCARMYQKPGLVGQIGIYLRGNAGTGKSVFAQVLGNMVQSNFFKTAQTKKLSNFNAVLRTTVLLFLDEPSLDLKEYDVIKRLLTDDGLDIEAKGYEVEPALNCLHIIFASNHEKLAQMYADDRRLCVLQVGDGRQNDDDFFGAVFDQLRENDNAGYKALFHYFRTMDLTGFKVTTYPKTDALAEQKELSYTPEQDWFLHKLEEGEILTDSGQWGKTFTCSKLREDYEKAVPDHKHISPRLLGIFVNKTLGLSAAKDRTTNANNQAAYNIPVLEIARALWDKQYGKRQWPDENCVTLTAEQIKEQEEKKKELEKPVVPETKVTPGKYGSDDNGEKDNPF